MQGSIKSVVLAGVGIGVIGAAWAFQPGSTEPETPVQGDRELVEFIEQTIEEEGPPVIDALIDEVYTVISGPAGERDWDRFRSLFADGAMLTSMQPDGRRFAMGVDEFIARSAPVGMAQPFYELELAREIEVYGNIAHAWSTYASYRNPKGKAFSRGINSFQLVRIHSAQGASWKVASILWQVEGEMLPIPQRYLPGAGE